MVSDSHAKNLNKLFFSPLSANHGCQPLLPQETTNVLNKVLNNSEPATIVRDLENINRGNKGDKIPIDFAFFAIWANIFMKMSIEFYEDYPKAHKARTIASVVATKAVKEAGKTERCSLAMMILGYLCMFFWHDIWVIKGNSAVKKDWEKEERHHVGIAYSYLKRCENGQFSYYKKTAREYMDTAREYMDTAIEYMEYFMRKFFPEYFSAKKSAIELWKSGKSGDRKKSLELFEQMEKMEKDVAEKMKKLRRVKGI